MRIYITGFAAGPGMSLGQNCPQHRSRLQGRRQLRPVLNDSSPRFHRHPSLQQESSVALNLSLQPAALILLITKETKQIIRSLGGVPQAALPPTGTIALTALLIGYWLGRRSSHVGRKDIFGQSDTASSPQEPVESDAIKDIRRVDFPGNGVTPEWLNYALTKLWDLFRKNARQFTFEAIQPNLDKANKPDFVKAIRLVKYEIGQRSPTISNLRPVPARSLAEIQCTMEVQYFSTSDSMFELDIELPTRSLLPLWKPNNTTISVALENLQIDAVLWSAFSLAPYEPYCTSWRYSLLETPKIAFDMKIGDSFPITAVPILRNMFYKIFQEEIPKDFMFPRSNLIDFAPEKMHKEKKEFMSMSVEEVKSLSIDHVKEMFPKQWAFYNSLDVSDDGTLSRDELMNGLVEWGYSAVETKQFFQKIGTNRKGCICFPEFCLLWPKITVKEVPQDYEGQLSFSVHGASNLTTPVLGWTDPEIQFRLYKDTVEAINEPLNKTTPAPVWNESFELKCRSPLEDKLEVWVVEKSRWAFRKGGKVIARASVPLNALTDTPKHSVDVQLKPRGTLKLDLSYLKFVDRWKSPIEFCSKDVEGNDSFGNSTGHSGTSSRQTNGSLT